MKKLLFILLILLSTITLADDGRYLDWMNIRCDNDYDCIVYDQKAGCVSDVSAEEITSLSLISAKKVRDAQLFNKKGECAKIFLKVGDIKQQLVLQGTHPECKKEVINNTITLIKYRNVTSPCNQSILEREDKEDTRSPLFFCLLIFLSTMILTILVVRMFFKKKYNLKIRDFNDKLKAAESYKDDVWSGKQ